MNDIRVTGNSMRAKLDNCFRYFAASADIAASHETGQNQEALLRVAGVMRGYIGGGPFQKLALLVGTVDRRPVEISLRTLARYHYEASNLCDDEDAKYIHMEMARAAERAIQQ